MVVGVAYDESEGAAGRLSLKHTTQYLNFVCLIAGSTDMTLSGTPAIQLLLDKLQINVYSRRHAVNHATNSLTVTFAKGGQCENMSERVSHIAVVQSFRSSTP